MHLKIPTNPTITVPSLDTNQCPRFGVFSGICPSSTCWMPCFVDRYDRELAYWDDICNSEKVAMGAKFGEQHVRLCWSDSIISSKVLDELRRIKTQVVIKPCAATVIR